MKKKKQKQRLGAYNPKKYAPRRSQLKSVETYEGESIEMKIRRMLKDGEPIKDGAPPIFTERKDGVRPEYNVRTDRWELAAEATNAITKSVLAKREAKGKVIDLPKEDGGTESTQGKKGGE